MTNQTTLTIFYDSSIGQIELNFMSLIFTPYTSVSTRYILLSEAVNTHLSKSGFLRYASRGSRHNELSKYFFFCKALQEMGRGLSRLLDDFWEKTSKTKFSWFLIRNGLTLVAATSWCPLFLFMGSCCLKSCCCCCCSCCCWCFLLFKLSTPFLLRRLDLHLATDWSLDRVLAAVDVGVGVGVGVGVDGQSKPRPKPGELLSAGGRLKRIIL